MKLNDSTLRGKLKTYLESESFQKKYTEQVKLQKHKWYWGESDVEDVVNRLKKKIWLAAELLTQRENDGSSSLAGMDYRALLDHKISDIKRDPTNKRWIISCRVELFFNPDWVHVASLYPEGYPNGVDNIIRLLTNGWDFRYKKDINPQAITNMYRGRMHGDWHLGSPKSRNVIKDVYAITYRRGNPILFNFIDEFNKEEEGAFATLNSSYRGVYGMANTLPFGENVDFLREPTGEYRITGIGTIRFGFKL